MTPPVSWTIKGLKLTLLLELREFPAEVATFSVSRVGPDESLAKGDQFPCFGLKALVGDFKFLTRICRSCDNFRVWFSSVSLELSLKYVTSSSSMLLQSFLSISQGSSGGG